MLGRHMRCCCCRESERLEFADAKDRLKHSWAADREDFARVKEQLKRKNAEHHLQNGRLSQALKVLQAPAAAAALCESCMCPPPAHSRCDLPWSRLTKAVAACEESVIGGHAPTAVQRPCGHMPAAHAWQESEVLARGMREVCLRCNVPLPAELDNPALVARAEVTLTAAARLRAADALIDPLGSSAPASDQQQQQQHADSPLSNGHAMLNGRHHDNAGSISSTEGDQVTSPNCTLATALWPELRPWTMRAKAETGDVCSPCTLPRQCMLKVATACCA